MKKNMIICCSIIIFVIIFIVIFSCFYFNKKNSIERVYNISLPQSADILEYNYEIEFLIAHYLSAKISIPKEDYESFYLDTVKKYEVVSSSDFNFGVDYDYFYPSINFEEYDASLPWWDLKTDQIDCLLFIVKKNFRPWVRQPSYLRIYVSESDDNVVLYLYSIY